MSITQPEPTRLTLMDQAVITYHKMGENFLDLLDFYLSCHPEAERHIRTGPNFFLLFRKEPDPDGDYWLVDYFGGSLADVPLLLSFMPYRLDRVGFVRYAKYLDKAVRFLKTDQLIKHYGLKTESTPASASASTSASASASSSKASDQETQTGRKDGESDSCAA
jgi:hypothetical protein